ncbi:NmrA family NAD(P)-binding protein [Ilumatobacter sp.]|uniref:NmrA family NAD(P)-binding protein n=1 Tax=Ilumatobacter sp. TaxID=1967498 RepID=UPI003AF9E85F
MRTTQHSEKPVLVLGGTGKTGRRVADRLRLRGVPVRIGSRNSATPFDWDSPSTWDAALDGVGAAYVSYYPDLAVPGAPEAVQALAAAALDRGVRRLVLLSGRGEIEAQRAEQIVFDSGADATVVRCAWFMQNFSEAFMRDAVLSGEIVLPGGDALEPWVDADDIADVAVAALTEPGHVGRLYELTSPRLYTMTEIATELSRAVGRTIRYTPVSADDYADAAAQQGVPEELVGFLTYLFSEVFGQNAHTADGVQRALGRPARDFSTFAGAAAAAGAWNMSVPAPA